MERRIPFPQFLLHHGREPPLRACADWLTESNPLVLYRFLELQFPQRSKVLRTGAFVFPFLFDTIPLFYRVSEPHYATMAAHRGQTSSITLEVVISCHQVCMWLAITSCWKICLFLCLWWHNIPYWTRVGYHGLRCGLVCCVSFL